MPYVPNAEDAAEPTGDKTVQSAALEFRTLKLYTQSVEAQLAGFQAQLDALQAAIGAGDNSVALAANLGAAAGSSLVGFQHAGTGAVVQTVQARLRKTYYPEDYGADPTGVAVADAAFLNMIAAMPRYSTAILEGLYKLTSAAVLTNRSNIAFMGKGVVFLAGAASGAFVFQLVGTCDDLTFEGITVQGENNAAYSQTGIGNNSGQTLSRIRYWDGSNDACRWNTHITVDCNASDACRKAESRSAISCGIYD